MPLLGWRNMYGSSKYMIGYNWNAWYSSWYHFVDNRYDQKEKVLAGSFTIVSFVLFIIAVITTPKEMKEQSAN